MRVLAGFLTEDERRSLAPFMDHDGYEPGRQGTGYDKLALPLSDTTAALRKRCLETLGLPADTAHDCYVVRYLKGTFIPPHKDDAPLATSHHRINCVLRQCTRGGELVVDGTTYPLTAGDAYVFRPDLELHEVTEIIDGARYIFTVGALG